MSKFLFLAALILISTIKTFAGSEDDVTAAHYAGTNSIADAPKSAAK